MHFDRRAEYLTNQFRMNKVRRQLTIPDRWWCDRPFCRCARGVEKQSLKFGLRRAEVEQQTNLFSGSLQVREELGFVNFLDVLGDLEFGDDFVIHQ